MRGLQEEQTYVQLKNPLRLNLVFECLLTLLQDPRWASWNLGVFVCIRCSGIHRGMGTHISRVKSVDLDSWTEEQMASILSWGNARANKYWEAKLAQGHVPSEAKIENFIRTKYELKRWAMEGPRPDPATLEVAGDDDVPLSVVKEKQTVVRSESLRKAPTGAGASGQNAPAMEADLLGGVDNPPRSSTTEPALSSSKVPPKAEPAAPKTTTNSSLLGLDFLGESSAPPRPASTSSVSTPGAQSRPDLKQSILSLYASAPKPQPQQQQSFGGMGSPPLGHQQQHSSGGGGFTDAFSSLSMSNNTSPPPAAADPFASFGSASRSPPPPKHSSNSSFGGLGGGSFFDSKPAQPAQPAPQHQQKPSDGGFGDFGSFASPPAPSQPSQFSQPAPSHSNDLFSLDSPVVSTPPIPQATTSPPAQSNSVFNLSAPPPSNPAPQQSPPKPAAPAAFPTSGLSGADVWGGNEWASSTPAAAPAPSNPPAPASSGNDFGWGNSGGSFANTPIVPGSGGGFNPAPKVSADEDFGGWASSTGPSNNTSTSKPATGGFGGADEDLFSNVWQ